MLIVVSIQSNGQMEKSIEDASHEAPFPVVAFSLSLRGMWRNNAFVAGKNARLFKSCLAKIELGRG